MKEISNEDLTVIHISDPESGHDRWIHFAHTINGYEVDPLIKQTDPHSSVHTARTLTELRCALFHLARADRWQGATAPVPGLEEDVETLLRKIRAKVAAGELE